MIISIASPPNPPNSGLTNASKTPSYEIDFQLSWEKPKSDEADSFLFFKEYSFRKYFVRVSNKICRSELKEKSIMIALKT